MTDIKLKIKDILRFNGNIYTVQAEEPINLEERGAVNSVNFTYDNNLTIGETITIHGIDLNDPENSRITTNNGISNWDIGRFTRITVNGEVTNNQEQTQVLAWINNNFSLTIDSKRCFVASEENIPLDQSTLYLSNESFENVVFPAIREYIRNHPGEFRLGEGKHENFLPGTARPWWSPEIPGDGTDASPWQDCQPAGEIYPGRPRWVGTTRIIEHQSQNFIHPGALTRVQYEELKKLISNTCQFSGCNNNYPDPWNASTYTIENDLCGYHRWINRGNQDILVIDREEVARYNQELVEPYNRFNRAKIRRINSLFIEYCNKIKGQWENLSASQRRFLSRLEAQAHAEPINIFTELQELVLLDANAAVETIIQQAERNIKQVKLNQILYKKKCQLLYWIALHEEAPDLEAEPEVEEAQKSPPLTPPLSGNWIEDELAAEKDNDEREKVSSEEGKKMSDKPEQPVPAEVFSHQKNQLLAQEKELAYQKIAQLLKKYNLETENLAPEWQNWREQIQGLNSSLALAQYIQQLEKIISQSSLTLNQIIPSPQRKNKSFLFSGLALILTSLGGLIVWFVFTCRGKNSVKN